MFLLTLTVDMDMAAIPVFSQEKEAIVKEVQVRPATNEPGLRALVHAFVRSCDAFRSMLGYVVFSGYVSVFRCAALRRSYQNFPSIVALSVFRVR